MTRRLVAIKLGGGLITDKAKPMTAKRALIRRLANEIAVIYKMQKVELLIGTGAGSYGHFTAHKYDLKHGAKTDEQFYGMCVAHNEVRSLNSLVADALIAETVPAFTVSPSSIMTCRLGALNQPHIEPLRLLLSHHCVPILHGDTILDAEQGTTISSTEQVLNACLAQLKGSYDNISVIYVMNEAGILDEAGDVMPELSAQDEVWIRNLTMHDVTGGIAGKVQDARAALAFADNVYIVGGNTPGSILKAINGEAIGTRIIRF